MIFWIGVDTNLTVIADNTGYARALDLLNFYLLV